MPRLGRRTFLELGGVAAAGLALPACIRDALEIPAHTCSGSLMDVEHVVILLQENRAFDHYFGTFPGVRGFGDRFPIPVAGAPTVWHQRGPEDAVVLPYHLDETLGNAQRVEGTPHSYVDAQFAWDHGRYGEWPSFKLPQSMGYYTAQEVPFQFALAEAFTLCDAYFCSMHSGTNPNRLFAFTGTNDPFALAGGPATGNERDTLGDPEEGYTWVTYAERLEEAGVSWKVYQDMEDNFSDNPLVGFRRFRLAHRDDPGSPLVRKGLSTNLTGANLDGLRADVLDGTLPSVSWVVGPAAYSEHPGPSSPAQGAAYVQQVLEALTADPATWSRTVLLVTFDENDGFFDHVPTPSAPSYRRDGTLMGASTVDDAAERYGEDDVLFAGRPYGPGVRVPMWIVSPWSRGGWVCSETFDHTSILRFLERRFGVEEPNISPFRRAFCGDLCSAFDFESPNGDLVPVLDGPSRAEADALRADQEVLDQVPVPDASAAALPRQATGTRPSRALPYELHAGAAVVAEERAVELSFDNRGAAGAVFHVYDRLDLAEVPRRYCVGAGHTLADRVPASAEGRYDLALFGPNGFHRALAGRVAEEVAGLEVEASYDAEGERLLLRLRNGTRAARTFVVVARAYADPAPRRVEVRARGRADLAFDLAASGRWYDVEVRAEGEEAFVRRLAGRVENGAPSVSDPAFGRG